MNAKRGYVPEDDIFFSASALKTLRKASSNICYLINEDYDLKQASTFVGNHFTISERQRLAIARSVATTEQLAIRKAKELTSVVDSEIWIDGFNTIITLEVMLSDSPLFLCMDGTVRDLAALRSSYRIISKTEDAIHLLLSNLETMKVKTAHILLDQPVSNSGRLKTLIAEIGEGYSCNLDIRIQNDVDKELWEKENVITSDSIILDHCKSWLNLMARITENQNVQMLQVWE